MVSVRRTHKSERRRSIDKAAPNTTEGVRSKRAGAAKTRLITGLALGGILLIALGLRLSYLREVVHAPDFALPQVDAGYYDYWARAMVTKDWSIPKNLIDFPDPEIPRRPYFHPPGYPFFLAAVYWLTDGSYLAARIVQIGLGLANCLLAYVLGRTLFGRGVGLLFALFMSIYWVFIYFEGELLSPVLLVSLGLLLLCIQSRWPERPTWGWGLAAGVVFGIYALVRTNILLFGPLVVIWALWRARRHRNIRSLICTGGGFCIGAVLAIAPVTIRNYVAGNDLVLITTNAGINLYVGNNETSTGTYSGVPNLRELGIENEYHPTIIEGVQRFVGRDMKDSEVSSWFVGKAVAYIRTHPWRTLKLLAIKAALFWGPEEVANNKMIGSEKAYSPTLRYLPSFPLVLAAALFGLFQLVVGIRKRAVQSETEPAVSLLTDRQIEMSVLIVCFILASFVSYLPFFIAGRYRVPIIPALLLFGAYGLHRLWCLAIGRQYRAVVLHGALLVGLAVATHVHLVPYRAQGPQRHLLRATCYRLADKIDLAIEECRQAIKVAPEAEKGHRRLGDLLLLQGRYAEAIEHYERAAQLVPGRFDVQCNLALAYTAQGDLDRAIDHFRAGLRLRPEMAEIHYRLARLLQQKGQTDDAIDHLHQAVTLKPDYIQAHRRLALALMSRRQFAEAQTQLRQLLARHPNDPTLHNLLGAALKSSGQIEQAIACYRKALELKPDHYQAHNNLANAFLAQGRLDEAIAHYRKALEIQPGYAEATRNLEHALHLKSQTK
ncbi:MAG: tetratricopeptide repeat protein [Phycisphaerales bacterium]|nr:MAG: tetratricopeptide repeat protein [Phycisphaerales bacterium]